MRAAFETSGDVIADRRYRYAAELAAAGDHAAASDLFAQAAEKAPVWPPVWFALAKARQAAGDPGGAADAFRRCVELDPDDRLGARLALTHLGEDAPNAAPAAYVAALFDAYADDFDAALADRLEYRAPSLIGDRIAATGRRFSRSLDLGCGTGLAGAAVRPFTDHLEGVDLSPRMVAAARTRGVYDRLACAALFDHLRASPERLDLITAADVFTYIGDLEPVFGAMSARLASGGLALFTVEASHDDQPVVRESLRFAHSEIYLRRIARRSDLEVRAIEPIALRRDRGETIDGLVVTLLAGGRGG